MRSFMKIVRNYEHICRLGHEIINHKDLVRRSVPDKLSDQIRKQDKRIKDFSDAVKKAEDEWRENLYVVNPYWSKLS